MGGFAYLTLMPWATRSATAGDHIDSTTTSFDAIRLTDSLKFAQYARNCPAFLYFVATLTTRSISAVVMLPMSLGLKIPSALSALPMSCITMPGSFSSATLPCHFLLRSSSQPTVFGAFLMTSAL